MNPRIQHMLKFLTLGVAANALCSEFVSATTIGLEVVNVANVTYSVGDTRIRLPTNEAVFTIQPPRVNPTIEFYRYSPNAPNPNIVQINGSDYSPSGNVTGPFSEIGAPISTGRLLDLSSPVPLIPASTYLAGELMFIQVDYVTANISSSEIDMVVITVEADNGDLVTLRLYESGPDTGEFWAYLPSTSNVTSLNDPVITTGSNDRLVATFVNTGFADSGNSGAVKVVADSALVNPHNVVFDSVTGEPVNGAILRLVDYNTGELATVLGVDEFSDFPAQMVSGETVEDNSGLVYQMEDGHFTFPVLQPGQYAIEALPPEGYSFASTLQPDQINALTGAAYFIIDASYGNLYDVASQTSLRFDIPLDPDSELSVTKIADRTYADVGDFVNYTVSIQNLGNASVPVNVFDTLPRGFQYVSGTSRHDELSIDDPMIGDNGADLSFDLGIIEPNDTIELNYALQIGPGGFAFGDAINAAVVRNGAGKAVSNVSRATIKLREDLLRSRSTIVGRISEQSCKEEEDWARDIDTGLPVEGVRIYTETGAYAVSDVDGLFHFEGVTEGTHVVQIDEETLPDGFVPMVCESNTSYAGSAISKFVDVQGGGIWRANFYLKQTGEAIEETVIESKLSDQTEYRQYDTTWLETQDPSLKWIYPQNTPSIPSANIGIKHGADEIVTILQNGRPVSILNYQGRDSNADQTVMISRWRGVDLENGKNQFEVVVKNEAGQEVTRFNHDLHYATQIERATGLPNESILVADGRTSPEIAIRLEDASGQGVNAGRTVQADIAAPYLVLTDDRLAKGNDLLDAHVARADVAIGANGIVRIKLEPTLRTGKVTVNIKLDNGRIVPIHMYLEPEQRDWIIVGLAEGSAEYNMIKDKAVDLSGSDRDTITDGRVAFFAKGLVKGNWLMTLAVDTDKRRGDRDGDFQEEIDPNAYYTLYGDRSYQEFEAQSRYPLYVKLEKKTAYALFGDYETNITEGRLTSYTRRFSGIKAEYIGDKFQVLGFAAETNQGFTQNEIPSDGTSGTYQLSNRFILAHSDHIVVETRDRNRPDIILDRREMVRNLDYTLDYVTGELIFRLPIDATDNNFNPNVIVASFETAEVTKRNVTLGGRVQANLLGDKVKVGSSFVSENGSALVDGSKQTMIGVDVVAQITDNTEIRVEYAGTEDRTNPGTGLKTAKLAELIHTSETLSAEAFFREEEAGFGLGQRQSNTNDIRRYGVSANLKIKDINAAETGARGIQTVKATAYHEDNLDTGDARDSVEITANHQNNRVTLSGGLRAVKDDLVGRDNRKSVLGIVRASVDIPKQGLTLQVSHEHPLGGKEQVSAFPERTTIGVDKTIGSKITASLRHELMGGDSAKSERTVFGLSARPWSGSTVTTSSDVITSESGRRLGATVGLDQQVKLNKNWSLSGGLRSRKALGNHDDDIEVAPDAAISPFETNEDFISGYAGLGFSTDKMSSSMRLENRNSSDSDVWIGSASIARELSEELSMAGALRTTSRNPKGLDLSTEQIEARLGASWRPRDESIIVFDRFDLGYESNVLGNKRTKIVNNIAANKMIDEKWQVSLNHGIKYTKETIAAQKFDSLVNLIGAETRYDITKKIDLGFRGQTLINDEGDASYSFGPSIGVSPVENIWISAGYNFEGYSDRDFEAAEYSQKGPHLKLRIKFDQHTARGLLDHISPRSRQEK